ncbi:MAG: aminopeptidase, partial [Lachnospiraceae bacterium]|nr:aminopeptidase [Lachnospiraceae bacterium]
DILVGSIPVKGKDKNPVKENIIKLLKERYGIDEQDFVSAELEVVPAGRARSLGLDESMVLSYGQDDRVCAYTSLAAFLSVSELERTGVCLLVDKEEIGSVGATGMRSKFFENALAEVMNAAGVYSELALRRTLANSKMLSSDVSASFDPLYPNVFDKQNSAYFGHGVVFNKYTGSRGKSDSNDANAEYMAQIRAILDAANVRYQTCELGKVDAGGGGTIAYIMSLYGMDVIDCGVAVLSMHSPYEVASKSDIYEATKAYKAFLMA